MRNLITLAIPAFIVLLFVEAIAGATMNAPAQISASNRTFGSLHENG
jgi:hypothetical protein